MTSCGLMGCNGEFASVIDHGNRKSYFHRAMGNSSKFRVVMDYRKVLYPAKEDEQNGNPSWDEGMDFDQQNGDGI